MQAIELEKAYNPKTFEKTIYQKWLEAGAFTAGGNVGDRGQGIGDSTVAGCRLPVGSVCNTNSNADSISNTDKSDTKPETGNQKPTTEKKPETGNRKLETEASAVLSAGLELWKYYHAKIKNNKTASVNASFYDIREFFQGRKDSGGGNYRMNAKSTDETYNALIGKVRDAQKALAAKIAPKVYEYGFLRE
jgi:hypothetical protein